MLPICFPQFPTPLPYIEFFFFFFFFFMEVQLCRVQSWFSFSSSSPPPPPPPISSMTAATITRVRSVTDCCVVVTVEHVCTIVLFLYMLCMLKKQKQIGSDLVDERDLHSAARALRTLFKDVYLHIFWIWPFTCFTTITVDGLILKFADGGYMNTESTEPTTQISASSFWLRWPTESTRFARKNTEEGCRV